MMLTWLKMKIKTLAEEARITRLEERKGLRHARYLNKRDKDRQLNEPSEPCAAAYSHYNLLHHRRTDSIRSEARDHLLAYGFLRGRTLDQIAAGMRVRPRWERVFDIAWRHYSGPYNMDAVRDALDGWARASSLEPEMMPHFVTSTRAKSA